MDKAYNHKLHERESYRSWEKSGAFSPPPTSEAKEKGLKPYCIIMPPPNANDPLHVGHAMFVTIEDILIRYHRMLGEAALWLPGTDHAGIETQYVFEKKLKKQGKSRFNFDRDTLYDLIWDYVKENTGTAIDQMKQLGASADWSRTKFTLDKDVVDLVLQTFEKMHEEGLVYRNLRLVNYCTKCGTGYSELEVKYEERNDPLYYVKYAVVDGGEPVVVATVRPETIFADVAVAIHPKHTRAQELRDKKVINPLNGVEIPIIEDEVVDLEFGTGMLKVTPGHDQTDFEIGERHGLEVLQAVGFNGKLSNIAGKCEGMKVIPARDKVIDDLKERDLMEKIEEKYTHNVGVCYRCKTLIEPLPMAQFFIKVNDESNSLTQKAIAALDNGDTKVYGAGHDKILKHWLNNLKDWNISRQIVWGIRMPIWYEVSSKVKSQKSKTQIKSKNDEITVGFLDESGKYVQGKIGELLKNYPFELIEKNLQTLTAPKEAEYVVAREKPSEGFLQETDTFDTWFSSSQWPVVTLKSNDNLKQKTKNSKQEWSDFEYYYPTAVMETAYDILPFWVMRMMMMGIYFTGKTPFKKVYFHGLVRDEKRQKMSKSKGNVMNPLELVDKYGADALRMALVMGTTAGHDSAVGENKVRGMRNFSNKVWNAARFIAMNRNQQQTTNNQQLENDKSFEKHLRGVVEKATDELNRLKIGQAAETLHNEFWHWFCDESIEKAKAGIISPTSIQAGLRVFMIMLHPFMPFVTEAVWRELEYDKENGLLISQQWPNMNRFEIEIEN